MNEARVETRDGCTLVFGPLGLRQLGKLTMAGASEDVLSADLAHLVDATFAFGSQAAVDALAARVRAEKLAAPRPPELAGLEPAAQDWVVAGEFGLSAAAIFTRMTGMKLRCHYALPADAMPTAFPHDTADFRRCRLLLEAVPSFAPRFVEVMTVASPTWAMLVNLWPTLCSTMDRECPDWRSPSEHAACHETYKQLREVLQHAAGETAWV
ncbi:hypothetical protein AB7849_18995 [Rhodanobacter sp. 115]|uniref:hypothetical protein n=1 Tax=Rhodanobacter sp. FW021-MT20 TaxID=1162282 RepID=UPI0034E40DDB